MEIYLFTKQGCINCPAARMQLDELEVKYQEIDIENMNEDLEFELLENQISIMSAPTILIKNGRGFQIFNGELRTILDFTNLIS